MYTITVEEMEGYFEERIAAIQNEQGCFRCGKKGHYIRECRETAKNEKPNTIFRPGTYHQKPPYKKINNITEDIEYPPYKSESHDYNELPIQTEWRDEKKETKQQA